MPERQDPTVTIVAAFNAFTDAIADLAKAVDRTVAEIARKFRPFRAATEEHLLVRARYAAGGNGLLVGDQWVCASCMGWLCDSCAGLGCSCRGRAHRGAR